SAVPGSWVVSVSASHLRGPGSNLGMEFCALSSLRSLKPPYTYREAGQSCLNSPRIVSGLRLAYQFKLFRWPVIERKSIRPSGWPEDDSGEPVRVWEFSATLLRGNVVYTFLVGSSDNIS
ncbi:hypothetical protein J6590_099109, partial [Homalodisca vitripennis]